MRLLVGRWGMNYLVGNLATIVICSLANFAASHWLVFRTEGRAREETSARHTH